MEFSSLNDAKADKNTDLYGFKIVWDAIYADYDTAGTTGDRIIRIGMLSSNAVYLSFEISWVKLQFRYANSISSKMQQRVIFGQSIGTWADV